MASNPILPTDIRDLVEQLEGDVDEAVRYLAEAIEAMAITLYELDTGFDPGVWPKASRQARTIWRAAALERITTIDSEGYRRSRQGPARDALLAVRTSWTRTYPPATARSGGSRSAPARSAGPEAAR